MYVRSPALLVVPLLLIAACEPIPLRDLAGRPDVASADGEDASVQSDLQGDADAAVPVCDDGSSPAATAGEYPSTELVLRIVQPTATGTLSVAGRSVAFAGLVFGQVDRVAWTAQPSGAGGTAELSVGAPYWQTDAVQLSPGDNTVTVTAEGPGGTARDTAVVTWNPSFQFQDPLDVRPPALFAGDSREVVVAIGLGSGAEADRAVTLRRVLPDGSDGGELATMLDDGQTGKSGDEIQGDGIHTGVVKLGCQDAPGRVRMRVLVKGTDVLGAPFEAVSPAGELECVPRLTVTACQSHQYRLSQAREAWKQAAVTGGECAGRAAAAAVLAADPDALETSKADEVGGPWIRWKDGTLGAVNVATDGLRGSGGAGSGWPPDPPVAVTSALEDPEPTETGEDEDRIRSRKVLLMAPFHGTTSGDEATQASRLAGADTCPPWSADGPRYGSDASLASFRSMGRAGVVVLATHGDVYFRRLSAEARAGYRWHDAGAQEVLWTGEAVDCGRLAQVTDTCSTGAECPTGSRCLATRSSIVAGKQVSTGVCYDDRQVDLMTGRAVLGDRTWGVTPEFVTYHGRRQPFADSIVYLGACRSLWNGTLAAALYASGARAILGWSGPVGDAFAAERGGRFLERLFGEQVQVGAAWSTSAGQDPDHPGTVFRLFGQRRLMPASPWLLNGNFASGSLEAWDVEDDGRAIRRLGPTQPALGKYMGIISTGLGYTTKSGKLKQSFCVPTGSSRLSFYWDYHSEEFKEYCGSQYDDKFRVRLDGWVVEDGPDGKPVSVRKELPVLDESVTLLCETGEKACLATQSCTEEGCTKCGWIETELEDGTKVKETTYLGLEKAEIVFDQKDVWRTGWQLRTFDFENLDRTRPVTLRFECEDKGDSIFDTAVLVSRVRVE